MNPLINTGWSDFDRPFIMLGCIFFKKELTVKNYEKNHKKYKKILDK